MVRSFAPSSGQQKPSLSLTHMSSPSHLPLVGPRIRIRTLRRQDLDDRQDWPPFNDPLHIIWDMPRYSRQVNDHWFRQLTDGRRHLSYGVEDLVGNLIGMLSLRDITWERSARLGISFSSEHTGQGYGSETLQLFLPYYFLTLGFERMALDVAAANQRAVRCYDKAGFQHTDSYWKPVDGQVDPALLQHPQYAPQRPFFRWRWRRTETLYHDMELRRDRWAQGATDELPRSP